MKTKLFDQTWNEIWDIELNKSIFWLEVNKWLIHKALIYQLSNNRQGTAHTKTRWERRGSTRKIYRQKGTWRARMWSNRSPIRKKGWIVFGPRNTVNYSLSMNKKERRKALFCALSSKLKNNELIIVDKINLQDTKTKNMVEIFSKLPYEKNVLLAIDKRDLKVEKSAANLPYIKTILDSYLNIKDILKYKTLVLFKDSLENLNSLVK